ncbi:MAG: hypothetical protein WB554_17695 [Desulfomonilaceae bacterium]
MKKIFVALVVLLSLTTVSNSFAFLDYLFSGSASRDAIDNSAVGDLRSWWSGNPVYTFNPYYSGGQTPPQGQQGVQAPQMAQPQPQQPVINYYPPGQGSPSQYGQQQQYAPQQAPQPQMQYGYGGQQPQQQMYQQQPAPAPQYQTGSRTYQYGGAE